MSPDDPRHSKRSGYLAGCRCTPCYDANRAWTKAYRYRASLNGGATTIDATQVREHLTMLSQAMSLNCVELVSGISRSTLRAVRLGKVKRVRPVTARAILAVSLDQSDLGRHWMDARSTRRRLQALHALGYSVESLEKMTGFSKANMRRVMFGDRRMVHGETADKVRAAYETHSMRLPVASNRFEQGHITRARTRAERLGWPPPLGWDDIDRDEAPASSGSKRTTWKSEDLITEYEHLLSLGVSKEQAQRQLGIGKERIEQAYKTRSREAA